MSFKKLFTLLGALAPSLFGQSLQVQKVEIQGSEVRIEHESSSDNYYILQRLDLANAADGPLVDIQLGTSGSGRLIDASVATKEFYRVLGFSRENPDDVDGDQIDDIYELGDPLLNPFDPNDADDNVTIDGTPTTHLDAYLNNYEVGRGMFDVTGPAADGSMMGYAQGAQKTLGIHDRQWARAFIVKDRRPPHRRVIYVVVDAGQIFQSIYQGVHDKIREDSELNAFYSYENIVLSATHTHGGAGGHSHYKLYNSSIGGFSWRTYDALVHGIYMAIKKAHRDLKPGAIMRNRGILDDANENRRVKQFEQNVEHLYPEELGNPFGPTLSHNRDREMTMLLFQHKGVEAPVAAFNWFPVHGVSVSSANRLLTADNKGNAAYLLEKENGAIYPGFEAYDSDVSTFVAGFANSNPGDMTANRRELEAPWKDPSPAASFWTIPLYDSNFTREDDYNRATLIGGRQYAKAKSLLEGTDGTPGKVTGSIDYRQMYIDMTLVTVNPTQIYPYNVEGVDFPGTEDSSLWGTCSAAIGLEFARGTLDGEALDQETIDFALNTGLLKNIPCQGPKSVLFETGMTGETANLIPISLLKVGDFVILAVPAEFTVMAGHRLRKTVENAFAAEGQRVRAVLSGLSNSYVGYVTTYEEYVYREEIEGTPSQGYEAASTHFGPFTLAAYQTKFAEMASAIARDSGAPADPMIAGIPAAARPEAPVPTETNTILDVPPLGDTVAATFHEAAGCPADQFNIIGTPDCFSCPATYQQALGATTAVDACEIPTFLTFQAAIQHDNPGCASGSFFDLIDGGSCWSCPTGFNRTIFPVNGNNACEKPLVAELADATYVATRNPCPSGYSDSLGRCYKCPSGYNKNVFVAWNAANACSKRVFDPPRAALSMSRTSICPGGYTRVTSLIPAWDRCYKCPSGFDKLPLPTWDASNTCQKITPAQFSTATKLGEGNLFCPTGQTLDLVTKKCYSCPSGSNKFITNDWNSPNACKTVTPRQTTAALQQGKFTCKARNADWFLDIGLNQCWSCPDGTTRNANPVDGEEACSRPRSFGDIRSNPATSYAIGETVEASFWAGHPKNVFGIFDDGRTNLIDTFFFIQRMKNFTVRHINAASGTTFGSMQAFRDALADPNLVGDIDVTAHVNALNFQDNGVDGFVSGGIPFPGYVGQGGDHNDFGVHITGTFWVSEAGIRTFDIISDDGSQLYINGQLVAGDPGLHGPTDEFGTMDLAVGAHELEVFFYERSFGGNLEVLIAQEVGTFSSRNDATFVPMTSNFWDTVKTDADWDTQYLWTPQGLSGAATIKWAIPEDAEGGMHRIIHQGYRSDLIEGVIYYDGLSSEFEVVE